MANAIKFQAGHNISPAWYCGKCEVLVRNHAITELMGYKEGFTYCPNCGEHLKYDSQGPYKEICAALTALGYEKSQPTLQRVDNDCYTVILKAEYFGTYSINRKTFVD